MVFSCKAKRGNNIFMTEENIACEWLTADELFKMYRNGPWVTWTQWFPAYNASRMAIVFSGYRTQSREIFRCLMWSNHSKMPSVRSSEFLAKRVFCFLYFLWNDLEVSEGQTHNILHTNLTKPMTFISPFFFNHPVHKDALREWVRWALRFGISIYLCSNQLQPKPPMKTSIMYLGQTCAA